MRDSMDRRGFLRAVLATSAGPFLFHNSSMVEREASRSAEHAGGFATVGLYASLPSHPRAQDPGACDFLNACGCNYLEFREAGFGSRPDLLPESYKQMSRGIS